MKMEHTAAAHEITPEISVIMPVHNTELYVEQAIRSILDQTFCNFEFIIVDDGSVDESPNIIARLATEDDRIRILTLPKSLGMGGVHARNKGLEIARAALIAMMDSDDIARPERLARALDTMKRNPDYTLVAGSHARIHADGRFIDITSNDYDPVACRWIAAIRTFAAHPTILFPRIFPDGTAVRYPVELPTSEDYGLATLLASAGKCRCLPDILVDYRIHDKSVSTTKRAEQLNSALLAAIRFQKTALAEDVIAALDPVLQAHYGNHCDGRAIANGLRIYNKNHLENGLAESNELTRLAASELHFCLSKYAKSQFGSYLEALQIAPDWFPQLIAQKIRSKMRKIRILRK